MIKSLLTFKEPENGTNSQEERKSTDVNLKMIQVLKLSHKDFETLLYLCSMR